MGAGLGKTCSPLLCCAGSYRTGNAGRNRLKRNRISPQPGHAGLRAPGRGPSTAAVAPARLCARTPPSASRSSRAPGPEPPRPPARSPEGALGRRGPSSGGDRARLPARGLSPSHARPLQFARPRRVATRSAPGFPAPPGAPGAEAAQAGRAAVCFRLSVWARGGGPAAFGAASASSRLPAGRAGRATARRSRGRGDGRPLTRGAEAARRGLDHWAAEGAARGAGPAPPGPLICLYYPRETKLPGTDARAPSSSGEPTTLSPPCRRPAAPKRARHPPSASCAAAQSPRSKRTPASFSRRPGRAQKGRGGLGWEVPATSCLSWERTWSERKTRGRRAG